MNWKVQLIKHLGEHRIAIYFEKNAELIAQIKKIDGARWSQSKRVWHIPDTDENRIRFNIKTLSHSQPSLEGMEHSEKFKQWLSSKRYSPNTIKTYGDALKSFLVFYREKAISEITNNDVIVYNNEYILKNNLSASYQNQLVNALKLYFRTLQNTEIEVDKIHRPRREHKLPNVLSKEEVKAILETLKNNKHKTMLSVIYACGLRRSELLNLKPLDIDSKRKLLIVKQSKGKKDRVVPISEKLIELLRNYYQEFKPKIWLFEGQQESVKYSERSLEEVLKKGVTLAKISKLVTLHWLRHSPACRQAGTPLIYWKTALI